MPGGPGKESWRAGTKPGLRRQASDGLLGVPVLTRRTADSSRGATMKFRGHESTIEGEFALHGTAMIYSASGLSNTILGDEAFTSRLCIRPQALAMAPKSSVVQPA
jgi:hypothetical protein